MGLRSGRAATGPAANVARRMTDLHRSLQHHFGYDAFRPGQEQAVAAAAAGRDLLVVMPTGAGKSLCYQLPALMGEDLTIVVSPLVSLMQDQVDGIARGVRDGATVAGLVSAQQDASANRTVVARAVRGDLRLLYVAPERFASPSFLEQIRPARIGLFVVDEAHCVSQWGHDFRPDYFRLADAARWLGARAIVASTATATPQVAADIVTRLGLRDPVRVATGFDRPNLTFAVVPCDSPADRARRIVHALAAEQARPAIVYAGTRQGTEFLAGRLAGDLGVPCEAYHAGLPRQQRAAVQRRFMDGTTAVIVATNAFGMGVDKPDVRTVAHDGVPASLEAYYQEAGRAGRDGLPARAFLFATGKDKGLHVFFIQRSEIDDATLQRVADRLQLAAVDGRVDVPMDSLRGREDADRVRAILGHLARAGVFQPAPAALDRVRGRVLRPYDGAARAACRVAVGEGQRARWAQYRAVWAYAEGRACRRATILKHFGDTTQGRPDGLCCDVCDSSLLPGGPVRARTGPGRPGRERPPERARGSGHVTPVAGIGLDEAIRAVARRADPPVDRAGDRRDPARRAVAGGPAPRLRRPAGVRGVRASPLGRGARQDRCADRRGPSRRGAGGHHDAACARRRDHLGMSGLRVVVLASGAGTNLQAILDRVHGRDGVHVVGLASDRPDAPALDRARAQDVPTAVFARPDFADRAARDAALAEQVAAWDADLVVLAGYMALLDPGFIRRFAGRIINVHPSLLPVFPGLRAIEQAIAYGVKVAGVTVHLVDEGIDTGAILLQRSVDVRDDDTVASLHDRLRPVEHELLCAAIAAFAAGRVSADPENPRRMRVT